MNDENGRNDLEQVIQSTDYADYTAFVINDSFLVICVICGC